MENLRVLFLCPQPLWPINTGARLRNFHLANALGASCQITVLQLTSPGDPAPVKTPTRFQKVLSASREKSYTPLKIVRGLLGPTPVTVLNYSSKVVARLLAETLDSEPYDAVQVESIHLFNYLPVIRKARNSPIAVLDWHNIESELMLRYAEGAGASPRKLVAARTASLLHRLEDRALAEFDAHSVVSVREKQKLQARAPKAQIHVIPNGVETAAFSNSSAPSPHSARRILLFVGSMDYHANSEAVLWFCSDIWPRIAVKFPHLTFKIVGRNPPPSITALSSSRIVVTGTVDDVGPFYHEALAVLVPLRVGGGTRLKILEAMAASVPVISTRLGAEGLDAQDQRDLLLADTAEAMIDAISALLEQPDLVRRLCNSSLKLVQAEYDWSVLGDKLAAMYRSLKRSPLT